MSTKAKVIVIMLTRKGCLAFATPLLSHFSKTCPKIYASAYATEPLPKDVIYFPSYRNIIEFFWNTITVLPTLLWQIRKDKLKGYKVAYFPLFHPWNWPIMLWCKYLKMVIAYTVHDGIPHQGEDSWMQTCLRKKCISSSHLLHFLTHYVHDQVLSKYAPNAQTIVIPHGIIHFDELITTRVKPSCNFRLLYLGRLVAYKGIDMLVETLNSLSHNRNIQLTIAGMPVGKFTFPDHGDNITIKKGWLSKEEIVQLLNEHDILLLPYREASQSGIIPLGIAAGIPMICTLVGGLSEQLAEDEAIWTAPNPVDLHNSILSLINSPGKYALLHQKMLSKQKSLAWGAIATRLEDRLIAMQ